MAEIAIRIENVTRDFGAVRAVDGLSLEVPAGMIFGFLGPNGAGKTTTIQLLLGLLEPTRGSAEVLGFDTRTQADQIRDHTGALLEHTGLYEQLSAEENLEYYGRIYSLPVGERQARIEELLRRIGLWERRGDRVEKWSRGMKQKLALARTLIHTPPLVFLDEPTAGLDVMAANEVREELAALATETGTTVFLTTHNMAEAERLCGQVAVIREGQLVAMGHPDELRSRGGERLEVVGGGLDGNVLSLLERRPEVAAVEIANDRLVIDLVGDVDTAPLVSLMVKSGVEIEEVRKGKASLEDVFVTLMEEGE